MGATATAAATAASVLADQWGIVEIVELPTSLPTRRDAGVATGAAAAAAAELNNFP